MDFWQLAQSWSPVWEFEARPLERALVERCLEAAHAAPAPPGDPPWRFSVLAGAGPCGALAAALRSDSGAGAAAGAAIVGQAPVVIAVAVVSPPAPAGIAVAQRLVAGALANLVLCAWDEGAGTLTLDGPPVDTPAVRAACGLADGEALLALVALGYPAAVPPRRPRPPLERVVRWRP